MRDCVLALVVGLSVLGGQGSSALGQAQRSSQDARDIERRFLAGLAALDAGRPAKTIPIFQIVLAQDPSLIRVLPELARAFFLAEIWQRARSEFFTVLSANLPDPVRRNVRRFIRAIGSRCGFDWDLNVALAEIGDTRRLRTDTLDHRFGDTLLPFTRDRF